VPWAVSPDRAPAHRRVVRTRFFDTPPPALDGGVSGSGAALSWTRGSRPPRGARPSSPRGGPPCNGRHALRRPRLFARDPMRSCGLPMGADGPVRGSGGGTQNPCSMAAASRPPLDSDRGCTSWTSSGSILPRPARRVALCRARRYEDACARAQSNLPRALTGGRRRPLVLGCRSPATVVRKRMEPRRPWRPCLCWLGGHGRARARRAARLAGCWAWR